jgi:uncharacterized protein YydD (DUF2326 family)
MIHRVSSSLNTFKTIEFGPQLNILIADKEPDSSELQTRNSAGKTSLVEIVNLVIGASISDLFKSRTLFHETFSVEIDLPFGRMTLRRSGAEPNNTYVSPANLAFPVRPKENKKVGGFFFPIKMWRMLLGQAVFKLPPDIENISGAPTFRSLLGYFVRRVGVGGFIEPHRVAQDEQRGTIQVNLSYLFDLDYRLPMALEDIRAREKQLLSLRKLAKSGAFGDVLKASADIRPRLAELESIVRARSEQLSHFRVLPGYEDVERRAAELRSDLRSIAEQNLIDRDRLLQLRESLAAEQDVDDAQLASLFVELEAAFPDAIRRRLDEVSQFHRSVAANRRIVSQGVVYDPAGLIG